MTMPVEQFAALLPSSKRRRIKRGLTPREVTFLKRCAKSKKACVDPQDKPKIVKTHARSMIVFPQLVGCLIGVHDGRRFVPIEVKPDMIGYALSDFAPTRTSCSHGKPGVGATSSSSFVPLK